MELQRLMDQWESMGDLEQTEWHTATQLGGEEKSGWTAEWVLWVLCAPHRVRASSQEEEVLRNFERSPREGVR
jgi:hypothetical protein